MLHGAGSENCEPLYVEQDIGFEPMTFSLATRHSTTELILRMDRLLITLYSACQGEFLVGVQGFEPWTPCSQSRCATRLRYTPTESIFYTVLGWLATSCTIWSYESLFYHSNPASCSGLSGSCFPCYLPTGNALARLRAQHCPPPYWASTACRI